MKRLMKPLSLKIAVLVTLLPVILAIGDTESICHKNNHRASESYLKKLIYSASAFNQATIEYSVLELLELLNNSTQDNLDLDQPEYSGILVTFTLKYSPLGSWQWSAGNRVEGSPPEHWQWHDLNLSNSQNRIISCVPTRSHVGAFNVSTRCNDSSQVEAATGIFISKSNYIRFKPFKQFWALLDGIGETAFIFTGISDGEAESLRPESTSVTEVPAGLRNSEFMFLLRADWTDCLGGSILTEPTIIDACGICGGDGSECLDCRGVIHGNAIYKCGICVDIEADMTPSRCENHMESVLDQHFNQTDFEGTNSGRVEIIGASSLTNLCDGHSVEIALNNEDYTARSEHHYQNWTINFEMTKPPRNQAEVLKIWDSIRNLQKNLNNQKQDQLLPGIVPRFLINSSMLADGVIYKATLNTSDAREKADVGSQYKFHISKHPDPGGFSVEIMGQNQIYSNIDAFFEARIITCDNSDTMSNRIYKVFWNINGTLALQRLTQTHDGVVLRIPRHFLEVGKAYNISVFVIDDSDTNQTLYASASKIIRVTRRFVTETERGVSILAQFSQSHKVELTIGLPGDLNPSEATAWEVYWRCRTIDGQLCYKLGTEERIEKFLGEATMLPILKFPANALAPGTYSWTALRFEGVDYRAYSSEVTIRNDSAEDRGVSFKIVCVEDNHGRLNSRNADPTGFVKVAAEISGDSSSKTFKWDVTGSAQIQNRSFAREFEETFNTSYSEILVSRLIPGAKYSIILKGLQGDNDNLATYEGLEILTGKLPYAGTFRVDPAYGVALRTPFVFQIHSWVSGNGDNTLRYELGYTTSEWLDGIAESDLETAVHWMQSHSSELTHTTDYLPFIGGQNASKLIPVLRVCDYLTCILKQHEPLVVTVPDEGYTIEDIRLLERVVSAKLNLGSTSEALCFMYTALRSFEFTENNYWSGVVEIIEHAVHQLNSKLKFGMNIKYSSIYTEIKRSLSLIEKITGIIENKPSTNKLQDEIFKLNSTIGHIHEKQCSEVKTTGNSIVKRKREIGDENRSFIKPRIIQMKTSAVPQRPQLNEFVLTSAEITLREQNASPNTELRFVNQSNASILKINATRNSTSATSNTNGTHTDNSQPAKANSTISNNENTNTNSEASSKTDGNRNEAPNSTVANNTEASNSTKVNNPEASNSTNHGLTSNSTDANHGRISNNTDASHSEASNSTSSNPGVTSNRTSSNPGVTSNRTSSNPGVTSNRTSSNPGVTSNSTEANHGDMSNSTQATQSEAWDNTNANHSKASNSTTMNSTKSDENNTEILSTKEISEMLLKAEAKLLEKGTGGKTIFSGILEIHEVAERLCNRIRGLSESEATVSGNLTRVTAVDIRNSSNVNLSLEGHENSSCINVTLREAVCEDFASTTNCTKLCYGLIYFANDILSSALNPENRSDAIWETIVIGPANNIESGNITVKNITENRTIVNIALGVNKNLLNDFKVLCAGWDTKNEAWDTGQCVTTAVNLNTSSLGCECNQQGFYKLVYAELSSEFERPNNSKPGQELEQKLGVWFRLNEDYNQTIGMNKTAFEKHISDQLLHQLGDMDENLYTVTNVTVRKENPANQTGNIIVGLILERNKNISENTTDDSGNILKLLDTMLRNGTLTLTDLNNNTIAVPRQNLKRNAAFRTDQESGLAGWVILGAIVCIGLLAIIVVIRKHKREREDSTEQYDLRGDPIPKSAIKPVRHVDSDDATLTPSYSAGTMSTSFNSLSSPDTESGAVSSTIQWHANQTAEADKLNTHISSPQASHRSSSHRSSSASSRIVYLLSDQTGVSTNPMAPVDNSISSFPNSTMY